MTTGSSLCGASFRTASWIDLERRWLDNQMRGCGSVEIDV
jgi:hypothetical protein